MAFPGGESFSSGSAAEEGHLVFVCNIEQDETYRLLHPSLRAEEVSSCEYLFWVQGCSPFP